MRRVLVQSLLLLPAVGVLTLAGVFVAHDATWSVVVGGVLGFVTVLAVAGRAAGRRATAVGLVGGALVFLGMSAAVSGLWMAAVGREATATVTHVQAHTPPRTYHLVDDDTVTLPGGEIVAGPLRDLRHGLLAIGDRVRIVYDPTGLVRFPTLSDDPHLTRDAIGGPIAVVVGFGLLVAARLRRPRVSPLDRPRRHDVTVDALTRRLADEEREHPQLTVSPGAARLRRTTGTAHRWCGHVALTPPMHHGAAHRRPAGHERR